MRFIKKRWDLHLIFSVRVLIKSEEEIDLFFICE